MVILAVDLNLCSLLFLILFILFLTINSRLNNSLKDIIYAMDYIYKIQNKIV